MKRKKTKKKFAKENNPQQLSKNRTSCWLSIYILMLDFFALVFFPSLFPIKPWTAIDMRFFVLVRHDACPCFTTRGIFFQYFIFSLLILRFISIAMTPFNCFPYIKCNRKHTRKMQTTLTTTTIIIVQDGTKETPPAKWWERKLLNTLLFQFPLNSTKQIFYHSVAATRRMERTNCERWEMHIAQIWCNFKCNEKELIISLTLECDSLLCIRRLPICICSSLHSIDIKY